MRACVWRGRKANFCPQLREDFVAMASVASVTALLATLSSCSSSSPLLPSTPSASLCFPSSNIDTKDAVRHIQKFMNARRQSSPKGNLLALSLEDSTLLFRAFVPVIFDETTPTPLRNLSQHRFELILADELRASPGAGLRYRHQWEHSDEIGDGVLSEVTQAYKSTGGAASVHSLPCEFHTAGCFCAFKEDA